MNFCIEEIGTEITTKDVELDGNEVTNLLEAGPNASKQLGFFRPKGFLTANFVRPPVTIFLKFPTCVEISHILLNPKLGSQSSSAFMIQTETTAWKGVPQKHLVAKEYLLDPIPNSIVFRNPRFVPRPPFSLLANSSCKSSCNNEKERTFSLKHPALHALEKVIGLEVTILRVSGSSVPALGGLQVWGQPCARCSIEITNKLLVKWMRRTKKPETGTANFSERRNECDDEPPLKRPKACSSNSISTPEEFLDPITQEIMCQPIRLPCGTAVDSATLEKYYHEESIWGRPPNNPFTGQSYTENIKPIADASLKARIDHFLSQNSDDKQLQAVSRTVGTIFNPSLASKSNNIYARSSKLQAASVCIVPVHFSTKKKSESTVSSDGTQLNIGDQNTAERIFTSTASEITSNDLSMEDHLKKEMNKLLGKESLYLASSVSKENVGNICIKCLNGSNRSENHNSSKLLFYRSFNCSHILICRPCLLSVHKDAITQCCHCDSKWSVKDLYRVHEN